MHRHAAPFVWFVLLVLADDITKLVPKLPALRLSDAPFGELRASLAAALVFCAALLAVNWRYIEDIVRPEWRSTVGSVNKALFLQKVLEPNAVIGVLSAGHVPYYTDFRAVDLLGKSDERIARLQPDLSGWVSWNGLMSVPGHNKYDLQYSICELLPTHIQVARFGKQDFRPFVAERYTELAGPSGGHYLLNGSPLVKWGVLDDLLQSGVYRRVSYAGVPAQEKGSQGKGMER